MMAAAFDAELARITGTLCEMGTPRSPKVRENPIFYVAPSISYSLIEAAKDHP